MLAAIFWMMLLLAAFALVNHAWLRLYLRVQKRPDSPAWFPTRESKPRLERSRRAPQGTPALSRRCQVIPIDTPHRRKLPRQNVV